jgi:hypothetical protein
MPMVLIAPPEKITAVASLTTPDAFARWEHELLQALADRGVLRIRQACGGVFRTGKKRFEHGIRGEVHGKSVIWFNDHEAAEVIEKGAKAHSMWSLQGKTVPMALSKSPGGVTVFRKVSIKALISGKFHHPGSLGKYVMRRGMEMAMAELPALLAEAKRGLAVIL